MVPIPAHRTSRRFKKMKKEFQPQKKKKNSPIEHGVFFFTHSLVLEESLKHSGIWEDSFRVNIPQIFLLSLLVAFLMMLEWIGIDDVYVVFYVSSREAFLFLDCALAFS